MCICVYTYDISKQSHSPCQICCIWASKEKKRRATNSRGPMFQRSSIAQRLIISLTCWCGGLPGTCTGSSRRWCPEGWRTQSSTASKCNSYWQEWMTCSPTCMMSSGPLGCTNLRECRETLRSEGDRQCDWRLEKTWCRRTGMKGLRHWLQPKSGARLQASE